MDFNLTEEQLMLQRLAKEFTEREIEPIAAQIDREGKLPPGLIKKFAQLGFLGITIPTKYGGAGLDNLSYILVAEQVAYAGTGASQLITLNTGIPDAIARHSSDAVKEKYIPPLCEGRAYASMQFTEPDTGSDPTALVTTAVLDGDSYVINGTKRFITFGARDGCALLFAKDDTGSCNAFVIEKNTEGYLPQKEWDLMGGCSIEAIDIYFENMRVPKENLLGNSGEGLPILLDWVAGSKIVQCAQCVGMAQAALDESIEYAKQRMARGRPISYMQGIQWLLAEMKTRVEAARWLTYRAAFLQDQNSPIFQREAAAAKLFVVPTILDVVQQAIRIHGGYGYTKEFKIERLYRAVAGAPMVEVSLEINRSMVGSSLVR